MTDDQKFWFTYYVWCAFVAAFFGLIVGAIVGFFNGHAGVIAFGATWMFLFLELRGRGKKLRR
jgi:uncharacterized oligopeptide transporter (OPT) family protein